MKGYNHTLPNKIMTSIIKGYARTSHKKIVLMQKNSSFVLNIICVLFFSWIFCFKSTALAQEQARIVSLSPNLTEIIIALGGKSSLVGRSSACDYIQDAKSIPIAGDMGSPNLEIIIAMKPNAVVSSGLKNPSEALVIENINIKFYLLPTESFEDYYVSVETLGKLLGKEKEAKKEIERVKSGLFELKERNKAIPASSKPKVFWEIWSNPLITIGNKAFLNEFIELAGGKNITANINRSYFEISKESIMVENPDIIIAPELSQQAVKDMRSAIGWSSISAVKNNRVYTDFDPNLVNVFGPRMLTTIQLIHNLLYNK